MRLKARIDSNQVEIVKALRDFGCTVQSLAQLGGGVPDLLVGYRGLNVLMEIKDGSRPQSERYLTDDEENWTNAWNGQCWIIYSAAEALDYVQRVTMPPIAKGARRPEHKNK